METVVTEKIVEGVMIVKGDKGWGLEYDDGYCKFDGWVPINEAYIKDPRYFKSPRDATYKTDPSQELYGEDVRLVKVKKTVVETVEFV